MSSTIQNRSLLILSSVVTLLAFILLLKTTPAIPSLSHVPTTQKWVALTFDDGPAPATTPQVLSLLKKYHAHATFFVLGSEVKQFPRLTKSIVQQGSVVANHGWQHLNLHKVGAATMWHDAFKTQEYLKSIKIPQVNLYRPPYGMMSQRLNATFQSHHYQIVLWSVDTRDWSLPGSNFIINRVNQQVKPGAIILMHDGGGSRHQTLSALATLLPTLQKEGYRFVTVPQLLSAKSPSPTVPSSPSR